jgi:solute carrier family 45 protein 1/2/4
MIPPIADSDDPTSQVAWPAARGRQDQTHPDGNSPESNDALGANGNRNTHRSKTPPGKRIMSTWDLVTLSISMAGAQIAWTVELGYVTATHPPNAKPHR